MKSTHQTLYSCPDKIVQVIRKSSDLRRFPPSHYACVLLVLRPKNGTRVRIRSDGDIEFMPNFDELKAVLTGIDPALVANLPESFRNKPRERQQKYKQWNKDRFRERNEKS